LAAQPAIVNAMSVDVEEHFQVSAFAGTVSRDDWPRLDSRVERNTERVLGLFAASGAKATFFTLGWVAERHPALIRRIVAEGHELASHGYAHFRATDQEPEAFRADVRRTKAILEDTGGVAVGGYRAASFSIGAANLWTLEVLAEEGYAYSSSIYPVRHDHYGMPRAPRHAHRPVGENGVLEVPISTLRLAGRNLPCGGGGYFRLAPYPAYRWALQRLNRDDRLPAIFYFHPWEIDPDQPRPDGLPAKTRFRHYLNLGRMEGRLTTLLQEFAWDRVDRVFLGTH
jgi:polysaccharide deacetylase family protein (PEP-CTERM system associated)